MTLRRPLLAVLAAALLVPGTAAAAPKVDGEFSLSGAQPAQLAPAPDGNVWVALASDPLSNNVAKVTPTGTVTRFAVPGVTNPKGIVAGPDGQLWMTATGGVAHFSTSDPTGGTFVSIPGLTPQAIVSGPNGHLWTASSDTLYEITPGTDTVKPITGTGLEPFGARGIAVGSDGKLYVADASGQQIIGISPAGGTGTKYPTGGGPQEVAAGPAGQLGYSDPLHSPEQVGRIAIGTLTPATFSFTQPPDPFGITFGNDGAYWIADFNGDSLTRMTTTGTVTTLTGFTAGAKPRYIAKGPGDTLWVAEEGGLKVARVTGVSKPTGGGGGGGTPKDRTAPRVTKLTLTGRVTKGTAPKLGLTLSEAATLRIRVDRKSAGRRKGKRCLAPSHTLRKARRCARFTKVKSLSLAVKKGRHSVKLTKLRGLRPSTYRLTVVAADKAGNKSRRATRTYTVRKKPTKHTKAG